MFDTYILLLLGASAVICIIFIYLIMLKKEISKKDYKLFMLFVLLILILLYIEIGKAIFK